MDKRLAPLICVFVVAATAVPQIQRDIRFSYDGRPNDMQKVEPKTGMNQYDRQFFRLFYAANEFEIRAGNLAIEKGGSWAKEYGQDMVREHKMAKNELVLLAREKNVALPQGLDKMMMAVLNRMRDMPAGKNWDDMYREVQLTVHREAASFLREEIANGRDQQVRGFAVKALPPTVHHRELAVHWKTMMGG